MTQPFVGRNVMPRRSRSGRAPATHRDPELMVDAGRRGGVRPVRLGEPGDEPFAAQLPGQDAVDVVVDEARFAQRRR